MSRALRPGPSGKPPEAAPEIDNAPAAQIRQQYADCGPFRCAVQTVDRPVQPAVSLKELRRVIDVLGQLSLHHAQLRVYVPSGGTRIAAIGATSRWRLV